MEIDIRNFGAVVFDLDGTLVDSLPDMTSALNRCFIDRGLRKLSIEEVRPLIGWGVEKMVRSAYQCIEITETDQTIKKTIEDYVDYYKKFPARDSQLYEGVLKTLEKLDKLGIKMGICSNKSFDMVKLILESFGLIRYFCGITGGDSVTFNKPDGRHILETLKIMNVDNKNALMIGDTINDIKAAIEAKIKVVAVDYGYSQLNELRAANTVVGNLSELFPR